MRGKVLAVSLAELEGRITPAHAGKRQTAQSPLRKTQDHPRPCGEKYSRSFLRTRRRGSPPPMRGKATPTCARRHNARITPAHAGKSCTVSSYLALNQDHPRPCGEKWTRSRGRSGTGGSPPPMRGKVFCKNAFLAIDRITPAHAGKRLRKRRNTGIFVFQISRFHSVSHTLDTSYGNRPALYVRRLHRTPAALQASKAYDRARWAAYAWPFAVCPHTGS